MPHCIIEYAKPLEQSISPQVLVETVQQVVAGSALFNAADVRSRAMAYDYYQVGASQQYFLHVIVKLLSGRSDTDKAQLTQSVITALQTLSLSDVIISCECVEIHRESYQRT